MDILLSILVACIVIGIMCWIVTLLPIPQPFKQIAMAVCGLILLLWVVSSFGVFGQHWRVINFR